MVDDEVSRLKNEIEMLKGRRQENTTDDLAKSINSLTRMFAEASEDLKMDTHDAVLVGEKLDKITERLEKLEIQNEKIAKGIVAVADMLEDFDVKFRSSHRDAHVKASSPPLVPSQSSFESSVPKPLPQVNMPASKKPKKKGFLPF